MKNITILTIVVSVLAVVGLSTYSQSEEVILEKEVVEVEILPEWAENDEAVQAAQTVIKRQELEAKEQVLVDQIVDLQSELDTVRGELESLWTEKAIIQEIRKTFPESKTTAVAVARGESELDIYAYNPEWHYNAQGEKVCQGSYGLMQIACVHVLDPLKLYDPEYNLQIARQVYDNRGWLPWGAYTDGRYKQYLAMN